jgi:mRNA interferase RelE/StbE
MISKFRINLKKRPIKALEKISEPYYSNIKEAIFGLAENPRPIGYIKLKVEMDTAFVLVIIE